MTQDVQKREYIANQFELWGHKVVARKIRGNVHAKKIGLQALESAYVTSEYYERKLGKSFANFVKEMKKMLQELSEPNIKQSESLHLYGEMSRCALALYSGENPESEGYQNGDNRLKYYNEGQGFIKEVNFRNAKEALYNYVIDPSGTFQTLLTEWNCEAIKYYCPFKTENKFETADNKLTNYLMDMFDEKYRKDMKNLLG